MEPRKITVRSTKTQVTTTIISTATTLAELKNDLRANHIDYEDMSFFEGLTKTELKSDASVLPHDVPWKGSTTNELLFLLTNTNKKIKSGSMSRQEAYAYIKANNLGEAVKQQFGKNYTNLGTTDLVNFVARASSAYAPQQAVELPSTPDTIITVDANARKAIIALTKSLYENDFIEYDDKESILAILDSKSVTAPKAASTISSSYSEEEMDDLFSDFE